MLAANAAYWRMSEPPVTACVDLQAAWDELMRYMHSCNIAWDRIHPNQTGHMYIAHRLLDAVGFDWNHRPQ